MDEINPKQQEHYSSNPNPVDKPVHLPEMDVLTDREHDEPLDYYKPITLPKWGAETDDAIDETDADDNLDDLHALPAIDIPEWNLDTDFGEDMDLLKQVYAEQYTPAEKPKEIFTDTGLEASEAAEQNLVNYVTEYYVPIAAKTDSTSEESGQSRFTENLSRYDSSEPNTPIPSSGIHYGGDFGTSQADFSIPSSYTAPVNSVSADKFRLQMSHSQLNMTRGQRSRVVLLIHNLDVQSHTYSILLGGLPDGQLPDSLFTVPANETRLIPFTINLAHHSAQDAYSGTICVTEVNQNISAILSVNVTIKDKHNLIVWLEGSKNNQQLCLQNCTEDILSAYISSEYDPKLLSVQMPQSELRLASNQTIRLPVRVGFRKPKLFSSTKTTIYLMVQHGNRAPIAIEEPIRIKPILSLAWLLILGIMLAGTFLAIYLILRVLPTFF